MHSNVQFAWNLSGMYGVSIPGRCRQLELPRRKIQLVKKKVGGKEQLYKKNKRKSETALCEPVALLILV